MANSAKRGLTKNSSEREATPAKQRKVAKGNTPLPKNDLIEVLIVKGRSRAPRNRSFAKRIGATYNAAGHLADFAGKWKGCDCFSNLPGALRPGADLST